MEGHDMMNHNTMGHDMSQHAGHNMPEHNMPEHDMPASCSMNMLFNWQIENVCVVFESWHIHSGVEMLLSCLVVFCIAAGYEYLRVWSGSLDEKWINSDKKKASSTNEEEGNTDSTGFLRKDIKLAMARQSYQYRITKSVIYASLVAISFWLMLVFMTYNGFLMGATVLGAGFGHLVFGTGKLKAARDIQCH